MVNSASFVERVQEANIFRGNTFFRRRLAEAELCKMPMKDALGHARMWQGSRKGFAEVCIFYRVLIMGVGYYIPLTP